MNDQVEVPDLSDQWNTAAPHDGQVAIRFGLIPNSYVLKTTIAGGSPRAVVFANDVVKALNKGKVRLPAREIDEIIPPHIRQELEKNGYKITRV